MAKGKNNPKKLVSHSRPETKEKEKDEAFKKITGVCHVAVDVLECVLKKDAPKIGEEGVKLCCSNEACSYANSQLLHPECFEAQTERMAKMLSKIGSARGWPTIGRMPGRRRASVSSSPCYAAPAARESSHSTTVSTSRYSIRVAIVYCVLQLGYLQTEDEKEKKPKPKKQSKLPDLDCTWGRNKDLQQKLQHDLAIKEWHSETAADRSERSAKSDSSRRESEKKEMLEITEEERAEGWEKVAPRMRRSSSAVRESRRERDLGNRRSRTDRRRQSVFHGERSRGPRQVGHEPIPLNSQLLKQPRHAETEAAPLRARTFSVASNASSFEDAIWQYASSTKDISTVPTPTASVKSAPTTTNNTTLTSIFAKKPLPDTPPSTPASLPFSQDLFAIDHGSPTSQRLRAPAIEIPDSFLSPSLEDVSAENDDETEQPGVNVVSTLSEYIVRLCSNGVRAITASEEGDINDCLALTPYCIQDRVTHCFHEGVRLCTHTTSAKAWLFVNEGMASFEPAIPEGTMLTVEEIYSIYYRKALKRPNEPVLFDNTGTILPLEVLDFIEM